MTICVKGQRAFLRLSEKAFDSLLAVKNSASKNVNHRSHVCLKEEHRATLPQGELGVVDEKLQSVGLLLRQSHAWLLQHVQ